MRGLRTLLVVAYLVIGVLVALQYDYFARLGGVRGVISALLGIVLWPLVLLGFNVRIRG